MIKVTRDSLKKQNMVVANLGDYDTYRKRSIIFYFFLFGGTALSYSLVFFALRFAFAPAEAFFIAHIVAMVLINASLITWVAVDLFSPVPIPKGRGARPKIMSILCLFCMVLVLFFLLLYYCEELGRYLFFVGIPSFILYGLVALFAERCDRVREDTYCDNAYVDDDYNLNDELVSNYSFKDYPCNIWHRNEEDE